MNIANGRTWIFLLQRYIRNYHLVKLQRNEYAMMLSNTHNYAEKKLTEDD